MTKSFSILYVEDSNDFKEIVDLHFKDSPYDFVHVSSIKDAKKIVDEQHFDLFLLDWNILEETACTFCSWSKEKSRLSQIPIIVLSGITHPPTILKALSVGALDFLDKSKPRVLEILELKIKNHLIHNKIFINDKTISYKDINIFPSEQKISLQDKEFKFQETPFKILFLLLQNPNKIFSRKDINKIILGNDVFVNDRNIDTHIVSIRKQLYPTSIIESVYGKGYKIKYSSID
jgi:two-component system phosphate regulon response regulator PhoB